MSKILKILAGIYGVLGTVGSILIGIALGSTPSATSSGVTYKTNIGEFFLYFLFLEVSVVIICTVLIAIGKIIDNIDELLFYAHKQDNPEGYKKQSISKENTPITKPAEASNSRMQLFEGQSFN